MGAQEVGMGRKGPEKEEQQQQRRSVLAVTPESFSCGRENNDADGEKQRDPHGSHPRPQSLDHPTKCAHRVASGR